MFSVFDGAILDTEYYNILWIILYSEEKSHLHLLFCPALRENHILVSHSLTNEQQMQSLFSRALYCLKALEGAVEVMTTKDARGC